MFISGTHRPRGLLPLLLLSNIRSKAVNYSFTVEWSTFQSQGCWAFLPRIAKGGDPHFWFISSTKLQPEGLKSVLPQLWLPPVSLLPQLPVSQFYTSSPRVALMEADISLPPSNMAGSQATMPSSANLPPGGGRRTCRLENGTYDMPKQQCQTSPDGFCALHRADILLSTFCRVSLSIPPATPCRMHQCHADWTAKEPRTERNQ